MWKSTLVESGREGNGGFERFKMGALYLLQIASLWHNMAIRDEYP